MLQQFVLGVHDFSVRLFRQLPDEERAARITARAGDNTEPVPLEKVAGKRKEVPPDHSWMETARRVGTCLGD